MRQNHSEYGTERGNASSSISGHLTVRREGPTYAVQAWGEGSWFGIGGSHDDSNETSRARPFRRGLQAQGQRAVACNTIEHYKETVNRVSFIKTIKMPRERKFQKP
jgi:hypothetical protein